MNISIIIPVYNVEPYIEECLASVVAQEHADAHIECIIVDDCSPDKSMDIVRRFVADYQGNILFRLLRHEVNQGIAVTRNTGIAAATGDYILFVDSDDYLMDNCLTAMLEGLRANPDADVIQCVSLSGEKLFCGRFSERKVLTSKRQRIGALVLRLMPLTPWNRLVSRQLLLSHHITFIDGIIFEDCPWSHQVMAAASKVVLLPDITYYYRQAPESIMHTRHKNIARTIKSWDTILTAMLREKHHIRGCLLVHVFSRLLEVMDIIAQNECSLEEKESFKRLRSRLLREIIRHGRPLLFLYALTIFKPLSYIYSLRVVCRYYDKMERLMCAVELTVDWLFW